MALELLKDIADKYEGVSYADLFQLASATAIEARGPVCNTIPTFAACDILQLMTPCSPLAWSVCARLGVSVC